MVREAVAACTGMRSRVMLRAMKNTTTSRTKAPIHNQSRLFCVLASAMRTIDPDDLGDAEVPAELGVTDLCRPKVSI
jgi:hypothetical protein